MAVSEGQRSTSYSLIRPNQTVVTAPPSPCQSLEDGRTGSQGGEAPLKTAEIGDPRSREEAHLGGQWSGHRGHLRVGEQDSSMSQKEHASRPASPVSTTTPAASSHVSSVSPQIAVRSSDSRPTDAAYHQRAGILGAASEQAQPLPQRNLGVHHILNPTDAQTTGNTPPKPSHFAHDGGARYGGAMQYGSNPPTPQPFQFQGPGAPGGSIYGSGPLLPGRQSPPSSHAFAGAGTPRRILTPKSPMPANLGHGQPLRAMNPHGIPYSQPTPPESFRQYSGEAASERAFHPTQGHSHTSSMGPVGPPSTLPHSRAPSQSMPGPFASGAQDAAAQAAGRAPPFSSPAPYTPGVGPANRGFPSPSPHPQGDPRWGDNYRGGAQSTSPGMRGVPVSDGQIAFRIAPMHGEDITVPVDMHQGSRHADGKRLRNAGASARFRARKKEREMSQQMAMQKLQKENRDLQERLDQVQDACERYRSDRDRLRDIVYRTPSISEYAFQGPPSPPMMRGGMPGPEGTQHPAASHPPPSTSVSYGAVDATADERPTRRRRTESNFEYSTASYMAGPLPFHGSGGYPTAMSQPSTPGEAHGTARLPPLRMDQPSDPRPAISEPNSANTLPRSYSPYKREPYEAGWAVRGAPDARQL